jgi:2,3-diketo-5-methylthio-1-phosphopentane phosphatase
MTLLMPGGTMKREFFIDFDGTITKVDTCVAMTDAFAPEEAQKINDLWEKKEITTGECANRILGLIHANIDDLKKLLDTIEIDEYFKDFLAFCDERKYKWYILSDGYDFNIKTVLTRYGIENAQFYANSLVYEDGFKMKCAYANPLCGDCGSCKTELMEKLKEEGSQSIYIGDGYSDTCPAGQADLVFAKDKLYRYCKEHGIKAIHFHNFKDIIAYFVDLP